MADVISRAQQIDRNDLATFLKSPRLIKQIENVIFDVAETLPKAVDATSGVADLALTTANSAASAAA